MGGLDHKSSVGVVVADQRQIVGVVVAWLQFSFERIKQQIAFRQLDHPNPFGKFCYQGSRRWSS